MTTPNLFLTYVQDAPEAAAFYGDLFEMEPVFTSPRYIAFEVAPDVLFALWAGEPEPVGPSAAAVPATPRTSEVGLMLPGSAARIDAVYAEWAAKGVTVVREPYDAVFGRTFVIADPDGNLLRVSPVD